MVMPFKRFTSIFLTAVLVVSVSACGGGGSSATAQTAANSPPITLSTNADLVELSLSTVPLDQTFQASQQSYTASVNFLTHTTTVTPITDDANATVTVDGAAVISGADSGPIALNEEVNTITVLVTAEDRTATNTYTVEVTVQTADDFAQQAYIKASDTDAGDGFGTAMSLYEDTLVVGAPGQDIFGTKNLPIGGQTITHTGLLRNAGAAYVFTYSGGVWIQQAYLTASNAEGGFYFMGGSTRGDEFGSSVALSEDTLAIGAPGEESGVSGDESDNSAMGAGAVYVFTRSGGTWTQQAYVKASNPEEADAFGTSAALSGDTLIVGAPGDGSGGAVYVFTRTNGDWIQEAYLKASNAEAGDALGTSVALFGNTLIVGAPGEDSIASGGESDNSTYDDGAAYVFTRTNGAWKQQDYLKASNADGNNPLDNGDRFGSSVAISRDTLAIGAPDESSSAGGGEKDNSAFRAGAAYIFARNGGAWQQQAYIKASNAEVGERFGTSVALSGDTLVVGAPLRPYPLPPPPGDIYEGLEIGLGAAYVFTSNNGSWNQATYIEASNAGTGDNFGTSIALYRNTVTVGAPGESSSATGGETDDSAPRGGAVYVFQ